MKKVLIIGNTEKEKIKNAFRELDSWIGEKANAVFMDVAEAEKVRPLEGDIAIAMGGDGTFLRVSRMVGPYGIPIIGIHLGLFGFLAELTPKDMYDNLDKVFRGEYKINTRMLLNCRLERNGTPVNESLGVNDAVVSRASLSRLVPIKLFIDGEEVATYSSDGLIVSTPLGSTAHCLAAGGPILSPEIDAFVISPICPHTLTNRPLVISGEAKVKMEVGSEGVGTGLTVDGQVYQELMPGDAISVERSGTRLKLVDAGIRSFYTVLREKLSWGGSPKYGNG
ncbi:MAG: NAD(+)/NADH kinase [Planctomycetes bacterium]|nr:NAD(+)/NADH kinase [Planctomycetota bacterium]